MKRLLLGVTLMTACVGAGPKSVDPAAVTQSPDETAARTLIDEIASGAWDHPKTKFAPAIATALPPDRLRGVWSELEAAAGRFFECKSAKTEHAEKQTVVSLTCVFERTEKTFRVVFDDQREVIGLRYTTSEALLEQRVRTLVEKANDGDFTGASKSFGAVMRGAMPPDKFAIAWRQLGQQVGRFQSIESVRFEGSGGKALESIALAHFEKAKIQVKVIWDARDEVIGLFFAPDNPWTPPSYARTGETVESDVMVGSAPALPGTLTLPKGDGPFPAVVLIHGSGPGDRDEAIGGVRVFKDLALGLAARGVAVLRYDKRSRVSPAGVVTEKEEVLDGAAAAIELLKKTPHVNPRRVFVIGHSQGGNLAPRIAANNPDLAGFVSLAGNTRPLQDLVVDQYEYFAKLHPGDEELKKKVEAAREFKKRVDDPALKAGDDPHPPFGGGITGAYFLYQRGYDPVATTKTLGLPALILQGGRDYQVTMKDFERWKTLSGTSFVTLKIYPEVNHLFVAGKGDPNPEEYESPGHVDERVVKDVAEWIAKTAVR